MKGTGPHIVKSSLFTLLQFAFPLFSLAWVSRALGPEVYGDWQWVENLCRFAVVFSALGIPWYGVKAIAQAGNEEKKTQTLLELMLVQVGVLLAISLTQALVFFNDPRVTPLGPWPFLYILSQGFLLEWYFQGQQQYRYLLTRTALLRLCGLFFLFTLVRQTQDVGVVFPILFFINLGLGLWNLAALWPQLKVTKATQLQFRPHLKPLFHLALAGFAVAAYTHSEIAFLGHYQDAQSVSFYAVNSKILRFALLFLGGLAPVFLVQFSQNNAPLEQATALTLLYSLPVALFLSINSAEVVALIAGPEYAAASPFLTQLALGLPLIGLSGLFGTQYLLSRQQTRAWLWAALMGLGINLIANFYLVPRWGLAGATWTTLLTEAIVCLLCYSVVASQLPMAILAKLLPQVLLILLPGLILVLGIRQLNLHPWVCLGSGAFFYFGSLTILALKSPWFGPTLSTLFKRHEI